MTARAMVPIDGGASPNSKFSHSGRQSRATTAYPRTSYKVSKVKNPKANEYSREDIIGMTLAALLSVLFSLAIVYVIHIGTPIIMSSVVEIFQSYYNNPLNHVRQTHTSRPVESLKLNVQSELAEADFIRNYLNKRPVLYSSSARQNLQSALLRLITNEYSELPITLHTLDELNSITRQLFPRAGVILGTYLAADSSQSGKITSGLSPEGNHMFVSDSTVMDRMPLLAQRLKPDIARGSSDSRSNNAAYDIFRLFGSPTRTLSVGKSHKTAPHLSGTSFHSHSGVLNELLQGTKHWYIYRPVKFPPPGSIGYNPFRNIGTWLATAYPALTSEEKPIEIIQHAGEIVYVPDGWYHATMSVPTVATETNTCDAVNGPSGDDGEDGKEDGTDKRCPAHEQTQPQESISISHYASTLNKGSHYYYLSEGFKRHSEGDFVGASKVYRLGLALCRDITLLQHLAASLVAAGAYGEAETLYSEVVERNPGDPTSYGKLINLLISGANTNHDSSDLISELLERADKYGVRDEVLSMAHDSF